MAPTAQLGGAKDQRFSPRSVSKWYVADRDAVTGDTPTRVELDAATDMTGAIATVSGFTESSNFTETPDLAEHKTGKILDGISLEDGSINFYAARDGADASTFFSTGDLLYVWHFPQGDTTDMKFFQYAVEVGSVSPTKETTGATQVVVGFGLNDVTPNIDIPTV